MVSFTEAKCAYFWPGRGGQVLKNHVLCLTVNLGALESSNNSQEAEFDLSIVSDFVVCALISEKRL